MMMGAVTEESELGEVEVLGEAGGGGEGGGEADRCGVYDTGTKLRGWEVSFGHK